MVKKEELMIGDYVSVSGTPLKIAALGTVKAGFLDGKGEMFYHSYDSIAPIQLTDEILEKNGFRFDKSIYIWQMDESEFAIEYGHEPFEDEDNYMFVWIANSIVPLRHVHEVQHALRLCGIERRIEP